MKTVWLWLMLAGVFICRETSAQVWLKTEYIGSSGFRDADNKKVGGKGDMKVIQGGVNIPVSMKMDENNHPTAWMVGLGVSYASMDNKDLSEYMESQIFNAQLAVSYIRPLSKRWSLLASAGVGLFMNTGSLAYARWDHVMGVGMAAAIWHLRDNLDLGMGVALNTSFGYPMVFPALFVDWRLEGRYMVNVSMMDGVEISGGMQLHKLLRLKLVGSMNGMLAFVERDGKDKIFTQQYITTGLQPELTITKSLSVPITVGLSAYRAAFYDDRTLKAMFKSMDREYDPHFSPAFYTSIAVKYGF
ncbi:DUF6268 family outer membrane beta-barrel protein [Parabacteroides goldsteinii]|uniref:DUF6268 domain-containing protein n=1 Tax=Parabacteroides goldsteinii DSM 19448 = WAL 12034 TaxID=927665 RepID=A0A0F5IUI5_9BACT|nr:DUF6268 family outer membrane beta-barrel protein [Parabacteroides goldsteinii]KKB48837.1 hypothetical protein HMPREF1535_04066 [Parabacteroides goldsteinii DSM 19448 = WAL 12034]